jgi:hypothetical protein
MTANQARDEIAGGGSLIVLGTDLSFMTGNAKAALEAATELSCSEGRLP